MASDASQLIMQYERIILDLSTYMPCAFHVYLTIT